MFCQHTNRNECARKVHISREDLLFIFRLKPQNGYVCFCVFPFAFSSNSVFQSCWVSNHWQVASIRETQQFTIFDFIGIVGAEHNQFCSVHQPQIFYRQFHIVGFLSIHLGLLLAKPTFLTARAQKCFQWKGSIFKYNSIAFYFDKVTHLQMKTDFNNMHQMLTCVRHQCIIS